MAKRKKKRPLFRIRKFFYVASDPEKKLRELGVEMKREFPFFKETIKEYEQLVKGLNPYEELPISGEVFTREIGLIGDEYYDVIWSVDKLTEIVETEKVEFVPSFSLKHVESSLFHAEINPSAIGRKDLREPIYVTWFEPTREFYVLDGNHRAIAAIMQGLTALPAIVFSPDQSIRAMIGEHSSLLYKINSNINYMYDYMAGFDIPDLYEV